MISEGDTPYVSASFLRSRDLLQPRTVFDDDRSDEVEFGRKIQYNSPGHNDNKGLETAGFNARKQASTSTHDTTQNTRIEDREEGAL